MITTIIIKQLIPFFHIFFHIFADSKTKYITISRMGRGNKT